MGFGAMAGAGWVTTGVVAGFIEYVNRSATLFMTGSATFDVGMATRGTAMVVRADTNDCWPQTGCCGGRSTDLGTLVKSMRLVLGSSVG